MKKINKSHKINSNHPNGNALLGGHLSYKTKKKKNDKLSIDVGKRCEGASRIVA